MTALTRVPPASPRRRRPAARRRPPRSGTASPSPGPRRPVAGRRAAPRGSRPPDRLTQHRLSLPGRLPRPRRRGSARPPSPTATSRSTPSSAASRPTSLVSGRLELAQLGHVAEHRGGAPPGAHRRQRAQRGRGGRRVGVVRVVDDRHAVGAVEDVHPAGGRPAAARRARWPARPAACPAPGRPPPRPGCCRPGAGRSTPSRTGRDPPAVTRVYDARPRPSTVTSAARTSASAASPTRTTRALVRAGHRGDQRVVGVEHRHARRRAAPRPVRPWPRRCPRRGRTRRGARRRR